MSTQPATTFTNAPVGFEMVRRAPRSALDGIVIELLGYRELEPGHFRQVESASLVVPLIISFGETFAIGLGHAPGDNDRYASFAAGLFAGPVVIDSFGRSICVQVNFTPLGARRFFHQPMHELADRMVGLDDVLGAAGLTLRERLGNEPDWQKRFDLCEQMILSRTAAARAPSREVAWAYKHLAVSGGRIRVTKLARDIGWSRKHLAARFTEEVGCGPKTLARIMRFNRAASLARTTDDSWAGIATECGYADQAHLIREFRELGGDAPTEWRARPEFIG